MSATATITISGSINGLPSGAKTIGPIRTVSAAANGAVQELVLQSGANTITVPTLPATSGCIIQLPAANTQVVTLKGVTGDTGIALGKTTSHLITWDPVAPPANFVLTSAATQTGLITEITFF
jgi:hypothetical protein